MASTVKINISATDNASAAFSKVAGSAHAFGQKITTVGASMTSFGSKMTLGVTLPLVAGFKSFIDAARESNAISRVTEQIITSTGGAAKVTAKQVGDYSNALAAQTGISDELIQSGQNILLTFTGVRNEIGKGSKIFDRATAAATDMSVVLGTSVSSAAMQLGKALNDPAEGLSKLKRSGVSFTESQKDMIIALQKAGDTLGAQKIIMAEVEREFGGAAAAASDPWLRFMQVVDNLKEQIGNVLLPAVERMIPTFVRIATGIADLVEKFTELSPQAQKWVEWAALALAAAGPLVTIIGGLVTIVGALGLPVLAAVAAIAALAAGLVYAYRNFEGFRGIVDTTISWLRSNVPAAFQAVKTAVITVIDAIKDAWDRWGDDIMRIARQVWDRLGPMVSSALGIVKGIVTTMLALIKGDWKGAWEGLQRTLDAVWDNIVATVRAAGTLLLNAAKAAFRALETGATIAWNGLKTFVESIPGKIVAALGKLGTLLEDAGRALMDGLKNGIVSGAKAVYGEISGLAGSIKSKFTGALKIFSPSKVFHEYGENISQGTANGIKAKSKEAIKAAEEMAQKAAQAAQDAVSAVMGGVSSSRALESARRDEAEAAEDLAIVNARASTIVQRITAAEEKLRRAQQATEVSTSDVADAERELSDLRDEQSKLTGDRTAAERRLRDAQFATIDAMLRAKDATDKLNAGGNAMAGTFQQVASQAGLTAAQVDMLGQSINNLPNRTISIHTNYTQSGPGPNYGGGSDNGEGSGGTGTSPGNGGAYATGGYFKARAGGYLGLIGEGRANEVLAPEPVLRDIVAQESGGGGVTVIVQGNVYTERDMVRVLEDALRRSGKIRPDGAVVLSRG